MVDSYNSLDNRFRINLFIIKELKNIMILARELASTWPSLSDIEVVFVFK